MSYLHEREKKELERILSQDGQNHTQDLLNVLDGFLSNENHQTAADLHKRLKTQGLNYEKDFVEHALELFCSYGFAQTKTFKGREPMYEHRHLGQHHDHLICTRCGRVEEFVNPMIEELQVAAAFQMGFAPLDHKLDIYGLCRNCARVPGQAVSLCDAEKGERLMVCGHLGGEELVRRLSDMGLNLGCEIEVLGAGDGPVVVACKGSRLALGQGMSEKVLVVPSPECPRPFRMKKHRGWRKFARFGRSHRDK